MQTALKNGYLACALFMSSALYAVTAPTNVRIADETNQSMLVSWTHNGSERLDGFVIYRFDRPNYIYVKDVNGSESSTLIDGLSPDSSYAFAVSSVYNGTESSKTLSIAKRTTHTWTGTLAGCLGSVSTPPWRSELLAITVFNCNSQGLTDITPVQDLINLERLAVADNALSGTIPSWIGNFAPLKSLHLEQNSFSGEIPDTFADLNDTLEILWLKSNHLRGPLPSWFGSFGHLTILIAADNNFSGPIPPEIGNLAALQILTLSDNNLSGSIPPSIGNLQQLKSLSLKHNNLEGTIPAELGNLSAEKLTDLLLSDNRLSGFIPASLGNLKALKLCFLSDNDLTGPIPSSIGEDTNLTHLSLAYNHLYGEIPTTLMQLKQLSQSGSGINLINNCNLYTDDPSLQDFIDNNASSLFGGYNGILGSNDGNCSRSNPALLMYMLD